MRYLIYLLSILLLSTPPLIARSLYLIDGTFLQGDILQHDAQGILFKRWDNGGVIRIPWNYLRRQDAQALKQALGLVSAPQQPLCQIDGWRIYLTSGAMLEGLLVSQNPQQVVLKRRSGSIPISRRHILKMEKQQVDIRQVYTPSEIYQQWQKRFDLQSADGQLQFARLLLQFLLYDKARLHFQRAAELAPAKADEIKKYLTQITQLENHQKITGLISQIRRLVKQYEYGRASKLIQQLAQDYSADQLPVSTTELEQELQEHQKKYLAHMVPKLWLRKMMYKIRMRAVKRTTLNSAREYVTHTLEKEIEQELAARFNISASQVAQYFAQRPAKRLYRYSFGSGTFIVGLGARSSHGAVNDDMAQIQRVIRAMSKSRSASKQPKLLTAEQWWQRASISRRREWLLAYYALHKMKVVREEYRNCRECGGTGLKTATGLSAGVSIICPLCHGMRKERIIIAQ